MLICKPISKTSPGLAEDFICTGFHVVFILPAYNEQPTSIASAILPRQPRKLREAKKQRNGGRRHKRFCPLHKIP